jgi:hypothetical protein
MKPKKNRRTKSTSEEREKLKNLFEEFDSDIVKISTELRRGERSVRMNLFFMDLISESKVNKKTDYRPLNVSCKTAHHYQVREHRSYASIWR